LSDKKLKEKEYPVTISDWILFCESNASLNTSLWSVFLTCLLVLAVANIALSNTNNSIFLIISATFFVISILLLTVTLLTSLKVKKFKGLARKIMLGKITDPEEARDEYINFMRKIKE